MNSADIPGGATLFSGSTFVHHQQYAGKTRTYHDDQSAPALEPANHRLAQDNGRATSPNLAPNNSHWAKYRETIQQAEWLDSAFKRTCFGLGMLCLLWLGFLVYGVSQTS